MDFWKDLFLILQAVAGIAFSVFMMYAMYKTKKGVEKVSEAVQNIGDTFSQVLPALMPKTNLALHEEEEILSNEVTQFMNDSEKRFKKKDSKVFNPDIN